MSLKKQLAVEFDAKEQPIKAAQMYEETIISGEADLETYLNLIGLYFVCNDLGYAAAHQLSQEFVNKAWNRIAELADEAEHKFVQHSEIDFWRKYFRFIYLGEQFLESEFLCLTESGETLLPYLYLYAFTDSKNKTTYRAQAELLLEQVQVGLTEKNRYIRSVLEATL